MGMAAPPAQGGSSWAPSEDTSNDDESEVLYPRAAEASSASSAEHGVGDDLDGSGDSQASIAALAEARPHGSSIGAGSGSAVEDDDRDADSAAASWPEDDILTG